MERIVVKDGNETRVQLEDVNNGLHDRTDVLESGVKRLMEYREKAPPATAPGDLQLMASKRSRLRAWT